MYPRPKSVRPGDNYTLWITFKNGEERIYDMKALLQYPMYQPLCNKGFFNTVQTDGMCVFWNDDIDVCPDTLYEKSIPVGIETTRPVEHGHAVSEGKAVEEMSPSFGHETS